MLYLHCGWPRTGTTSLQAACVRHRAALSASGTVYPETWLARDGVSHHGIDRFVASSPAPRERCAELIDFLGANAGRDVLLSAEGITGFLKDAGRREGFLEMLGEAGTVMPVRCVWTLRRFDRLLESLYLLAVLWGRALPPPREYFERAEFLDSLFEGMGAVEAESGVGVAYVGYDPGGGHCTELLEALRIREPAATSIRAALEHGPRLYPSLSQKQAIAMANLEAVSERAEKGLERGRLFAAFQREGFGFADDRPCELVDAAVRRATHQRALDSARRCGVDAYAELFADAEIDPCSATPLSSETLTGEDLESLVDHLATAR